MRGLLKGLSVLEIIVGLFTLIMSVLTITGAGIVDSAVGTALEEQVVTLLRVIGVLGIISGIFNFACGFNGWKGAKGDMKKLNTAILLGWVGLILAVISAIMTIYGNVNINNIISAIASAIVPVLFLVSAMNVKKNS